MANRVLITGGASGLGWALAQLYHAAGWHVILVDRDREKLAQCDTRLSSNYQSLCLDLTHTVNAEVQLELVLAGGLNLLINNAGITHRSKASVTDHDVFERVMAVNWSAPVFLSQLCLPALEASRGGIICISSMAGRMPVPGRAAYGASKAALMMHFEAWRPELQKRNIELLMVYPSFLATAIEENALGSDGQRTDRPRSVIGTVHSADSMAHAIVKAQNQNKKRLLAPQLSSRIGMWIWFHAPWLYQKITWKKFAEELV